MGDQKGPAKGFASTSCAGSIVGDQLEAAAVAQLEAERFVAAADPADAVVGEDDVGRARVSRCRPRPRPCRTLLGLQPRRAIDQAV